MPGDGFGAIQPAVGIPQNGAAANGLRLPPGVQYPPGDAAAGGVRTVHAGSAAVGSAFADGGQSDQSDSHYAAAGRTGTGTGSSQPRQSISSVIRLPRRR